MSLVCSSAIYFAYRLHVILFAWYLKTDSLFQDFKIVENFQTYLHLSD